MHNPRPAVGSASGRRPQEVVRYPQRGPAGPVLAGRLHALGLPDHGHVVVFVANPEAPPEVLWHQRLVQGRRPLPALPPLHALAPGDAEVGLPLHAVHEDLPRADRAPRLRHRWHLEELHDRLREARGRIPGGPRDRGHSAHVLRIGARTASLVHGHGGRES